MVTFLLASQHTKNCVCVYPETFLTTQYRSQLDGLKVCKVGSTAGLIFLTGIVSF